MDQGASVPEAGCAVSPSTRFGAWIQHRRDSIDSHRAISRRARTALVGPSRQRALAVQEVEPHLRDAAVDGREPLRALRSQNAGAPDEQSYRIFSALRGAVEL